MTARKTAESDKDQTLEPSEKDQEELDAPKLTPVDVLRAVVERVPWHSETVKREYLDALAEE